MQEIKEVSLSEKIACKVAHEVSWVSAIYFFAGTVWHCATSDAPFGWKVAAGGIGLMGSSVSGMSWIYWREEADAHGINIARWPGRDEKEPESEIDFLSAEQKIRMFAMLS